jgi:ribosomal protein S18 acetylase RimI-like enzyme
MSLTLVPMSDAQAQAYLAALLPPYAAERAIADRCPLEEAERFARDQQARLLPQGPRTPGHRFLHLVQEPAGESVGAVWLFVDPASRQAFLYDIEILPTARRRGLATAALGLVEQTARGAGCTVLGLNLFATNTAAAALYAKAGYRAVSCYLNKDL